MKRNILIALICISMSSFVFAQSGSINDNTSTTKVAEKELIRIIKKLVNNSLVINEKGNLVLSKEGKETKEVLEFLRLLNNQQIVSAYILYGYALKKK